MLLVIAIVLTSKCVLFAADDPVQSQAIRELERLGAIVERDHKRPGSPVTGVRFRENSRFGDEDVPLLRPLTNLATLDLSNTKVCGTHIRGAGLRELRTLASLTTLSFGPSQISDAGLDQISELRNLRILDLPYAEITDAGLLKLKDLKQLTKLNLTATKIGDAGLRQLGQCKHL